MTQTLHLLDSFYLYEISLRGSTIHSITRYAKESNSPGVQLTWAQLPLGVQDRVVHKLNVKDEEE